MSPPAAVESAEESCDELETLIVAISLLALCAGSRYKPAELPFCCGFSSGRYRPLLLIRSEDKEEWWLPLPASAFTALLPLHVFDVFDVFVLGGCDVGCPYARVTPAH